MMLELKNTGTEPFTIAPGATVTLEVGGGDPPPSSGTLAPAVAAWNTAHANDHVVTGGLDPYVTDTGLGTGSGGGTFFDLALTRAIRQIGTINAVRFNFSALGPVRFQIWRPDGAGHLALIEETATFTPSATGEQLYVLPTPLTLAQPGDVPGIWGDNATLRCKQESTLETGWAAGAPTSITLADVPTGYQYNRILGLTFYGPAPFAAINGDSIDAGHGSPFHRTFLDGGPSGDAYGEPFYHVRNIVTALKYQNFAKGSEGWAWSAANVSKMAAVTPRVAIFGAGVNDLARSWSAVSADMATCKAGLPSGTKMMVREMTADNAAATGAVAARNALTASWCAANSAVLIPMHDAMAQIRTSTGLLEDLKAAYDCGDGIHHNLAGKQKMAELELAVLDGYSW